MVINFKYKVGELVTTTAVRQMMIPNVLYPSSVPMVLTVVEQRSITCSAGTQLLYACRVTHSSSVTLGTTTFQQFELTDDLSCVKPKKKDVEPEKKDGECSSRKE